MDGSTHDSDSTSDTSYDTESDNYSDNYSGNNSANQNVYSPEELAWKLIIDDKIDSAAIVPFADENSKEILFEILMTVYIEMVFDFYKLKHLENLSNMGDNNGDNFNLDISNVNLESLTGIFCEKFNKIKYILNVYEISRETYEYTKKNRYCTVLLRNSPTDSTYFMINKDRLDPEIPYHFVLNSMYQPNNELRDIYCSLCINSKYYKISFMSAI